MEKAKVAKMIIRLRDALNDACNTGMYDEEEIKACINIIRADERTKTLDECKAVMEDVLKQYQEEYFKGVTFYDLRNNTLNEIEKLKHTRLDM